jgi:hypothetical protein
VAYLSLSFVRRAAAAVAVAVVAAAAPARADFVLDDFAAPSPALFYQITGTNPNPYTPASSPLGDVTRTTTVTVISGIGPSAATGQYGGGVFELSTPAASTAVAQLNYQYNSAAGSDYAALGVSAFTLQFTFADLNIPYSILLTDTNGDALTYTSVASSGPGTYTANLGDFTGTADLTSVASIDVFLNRNVTAGTSTTSADFILDEVGVLNEPPQPPAVPAPPAALLALAVLPVVGVRKLLRKKA